MDEDAEKRDTMRKVTLAKTAGFCFGVSRAVDMVYNEIRKGKRVATLGPIIHNESVVSDLARKGVSVIDEPALYDESTDVTGMTVVIRLLCEEKNEDKSSICAGLRGLLT